MSIKNNDWVAVLMNIESDENVQLGNNPMATLYSNGITPDTTGMQNEDYYKNIPQVQERFKNKNTGEFDDNAFKQFYNSALRSYNEFAEIPFVEKMLDEIGTTPYDSSRISRPERIVKNISAVLTPFHDKNRTTYGTGNLWETGTPTFSDREVAQANFVRDENGNKLDWTPNDHAGVFKSLFNPALVYASYDEDVFDEEGRLIHQKGELKLDENGDPYTELLGNRESAGKNIVKWTETFSVDGTFANKLDIFDSDSFEKNAWKTVAKTGVMLLPYLTPAGAAMGWVSAGMALSKALPVLVKTLNGLATNDPDNALGKSMNWLDNVMGRFDASVSDKAQGKFFSLENIGDLIVSSAGQLYSQRQIANKLYTLKPFSNPETNKKFAQHMSTAYMALTSATESYNQFREAGANARMAGVGSLLTMGAFHLLLSHGYFKDKLFEGTLLDEDIRAVHNVGRWSKDVLKKLYPDLAKDTPDPKGIAKAWSTIKRWVAEAPKGLVYEPAVYASRGVNEGLEEMTEEVAQDVVKLMAKGLETIGFDVTEGEGELDFNWTPGSALERYGTSFIGGFLGGMVFEGLTQKDLRNDPRYQKFLNSAPLRQMYYDIGQGKAEKYRQIIKQRGEKGLNGNAAIGTRFDETAMSEDGKPGAYKAGTDKDNQNVAVTNAMLQLVDEAEDIYKTYGLIMSNPDLLKAVLGNETIKQRIQELGINEHEYLLSGILVPNASEADYIVDAILDAKYSEDGETPSADSPTLEKILAENVLNDVNSLRQEILYLEKKIRDEYAKLPAEKQTSEGRKELERESSYLKGLIEDRDALVEQFEEIIQGKHSDRFLNQVLFMLQGSPLKYWDNLGGSIADEGGSTKNIAAFAKFNYGVADFDSLEEGDLKRLIRERYDDYLTMKHARLRKIAEMNLMLSETLNPVFTKLTERLKDAKEHESYLYGSKRAMIGEVVSNLQAEVETLEQQLQQLTDQGKAGDPEAVEVIGKIQKINASLEAYHALPLEMSFEEWFSGSIDIEGDNDAAVAARQQMVLDFYESAIAEKAVYVKDDYLKEYLERTDWLYVIDTFNALAKVAEDYDLDIRKVAQQFIEDESELDAFVARAEVLAAADPNLQISEIIATVADEFSFDEETVLEAIDKQSSFFKSHKNNFVDRINTFINNIKQNPTALDVEIQAFVNFINGELDSEGDPLFVPERLARIPQYAHIKDAQGLIEYLFNPTGAENSVFDFIRKVNELIDKTEKSPIFELLQQVSMQLTGKPSKILDIIAREKSLMSAQRFQNYLMSDAATKELYDAQAILNILTALVESGSGGLNELINTRRKNVTGKEDLYVIDENTANILKHELEFVQRQINSLKKLSQDNRNNKLSENKKVTIYDSVKRFMSFVLPEDEDIFEKTLEERLKELFEKHGFTSFREFVPKDKDGKPLEFNKDTIAQWSDADYNAFYKAESEFKEKLAAWFNSLTDEQKKDVMEVIADVAGEFDGAINMSQDEFSADPEYKVGVWGNIRYLLSNLTTSFYEFQGYYKEVNNDSEFLPFGGQEFVVRDAYSAFVAKDHYNVFMAKLLVKFKEKKGKTPDGKEDSFVMNYEDIKNFFFIDGVPGSGKSTAVAGILAKILKLKYGKRIKIIGLVHEDSGKKGEESRKNQFAKNLGISESDCYVTEDFIEEHIVKGIKSPEKERSRGGHINEETLEKAKNVTSFSEFDSSDTIYLFVSDEETFMNEAQLIAFSKWISADNRGYLLGLGDMFQSGADNSNLSDITDCYFQTSIRLTTTFRAENSGKADNEQTARDILQTAFKRWSNDRTSEEKQLSEDIWTVLGATTKPFIGCWGTDGRIYGDVSIQRNEITERIKKLLELERKPSIVIITDNPDDYNEWIAQGVVVKTPKQAQGGQWDYCFVDANISITVDSEENYINFKKFYTIMTRAKHGTAWVGSKLSGVIRFKNDENARYEVGADMRMEGPRKDYITWRKKLFELLPLSGVTSADSGGGESGGSGSGNGLGVESGSGSSSDGEASLPGFESRVEALRKVFSPLTDSETRDIRRRYYEIDSDDPKVLEFRKKHGYWVGPYRTRKQSVDSGESMDYDFWFDWISKRENIADACPISNTNESEWVEYKHYLQVVQDFILRWKSSEDPEEVLAEMENYDAGERLQPLHDRLANFISNDSAYLETREVGVENEAMIYLRLDDGQGDTKVLPLFAKKGVVPGKVYKLSETSIEFLTRPIPISSNGEKFVPIEAFTKKIGIRDQIIIFKGFKEGSDEYKRLSPQARIFNDANHGKAFVLVDNVSGDKRFTEWPDYLQLKIENGEISTFIDPEGNRYVSLIGLQKVCSSSDFREICSTVAAASFAKDKSTYYDSITKLNRILGKISASENINADTSINDVVTVPNYALNLGTDGSGVKLETIFPSSVCNYVLNMLLRHSQNASDGNVLLKNWLSLRKTNAIRLEYGSGDNIKYLILTRDGDKITAYIDSRKELKDSESNDDGTSRQLKFEIDTSKITDPGTNIISYWTSVLQQIFENENISKYFGFQSKDVLTKLGEKVGDKFALNFVFGYTKKDDTSAYEVFANSDFSHTLAVMANDIDDWTHVSRLFDLFRHEINMNITADEYDDRPESMGVWGLLKNHDDPNYGADIVDVLPATYKMKLGAVVLDMKPTKFEQTYDGNSILSIENTGISPEADGWYSFDGFDEFSHTSAVKVNTAWLNANSPSEIVSSSDEWFLEKIKKNSDGTWTITAWNKNSSGMRPVNITLNPESGTELFNRFRDSAKKLGEHFTIKKGVVYVDNEPIKKIIGFYRNGDEVSCAFVDNDGELKQLNINESWMSDLRNSLTDTGDLVVIDENLEWAVYIDEDNNFKFVKNPVDDSPAIKSLSINKSEKTVNGIKLSDQVFADFMESYNGISELRGLNSEYEDFKKQVIGYKEISKLPDFAQSQIREILEMSDSKEEAVEEINKYLDSIKYEIGIKIELVDDQITTDNNMTYQIGKKVSQEITSDWEITNVETSNSEEFFVTLRNGDDVRTESWVYNSTTGKVSLKPTPNSKVKTILNDLYNIAPIELRALIDFSEAMTRDLTPDEWKSLVDSILYDGFDVLLANPEIYKKTKQLEEAIKELCNTK